jgi:GT2 family glycosyltransferase
MSAYNAATYIDESVSSILAQTFRDFEFIIINNGSLDQTRSILDRYRKLDSRIRLYYHEQEGLAPALNYGFRLARGRYIAVMDSDDFSLSRRLEMQLDYMERHPEIGILGAWIVHMDAAGTLKSIWSPPTNPKTVKWTNFFGVCVPCQSMLMRREIAARLDYFRTDLAFAADVDFLLRASSITELSNVPVVLHRYRIWPGSTTQFNFSSVHETHVRLLAAYVTDFLKLEPPVEAVRGLRQTRIGPPVTERRQIGLTADLIQRISRRFVQQNHLSLVEKREISWDAAKRLALLAVQASRCGALGSLPLFMRAVRMDHRMLSPAVFVKGRELWRSARCECLSNHQ